MRLAAVSHRCHTVRPDRPGRSCCVKPTKPPERPDLATYSQLEQFALGAAPTWNSPDILTNLWSPWRLLEEVEIKVRNLSPTAAAVNGAVHLYFGPFGIGMQRTLLATRMVTLPPGAETALKYALAPAVLAGDPRVSVHAAIEHPHDSNAINNRASQITYGVFTSDVGRDPALTFPVLNQSGAVRQITLSVLPNDLGAAVAPAARVYAPWEQVTATLTVHVPASLHGSPGSDVRREVTVVGRGPDGAVIDGVTHIVRIDT